VTWEAIDGIDGIEGANDGTVLEADSDGSSGGDGS
jgi:hypothetical protein